MANYHLGPHTKKFSFIWNLDFGIDCVHNIYSLTYRRELNVVLDIVICLVFIAL